MWPFAAIGSVFVSAQPDAVQWKVFTPASVHVAGVVISPSSQVWPFAAIGSVFVSVQPDAVQWKVFTPASVHVAGVVISPSSQVCSCAVPGIVTVVGTTAAVTASSS